MASKYRKKFELPEGFMEILQDYSREVLRDQPLDIVEFSYLYFKALEEVSSLKLILSKDKLEEFNYDKKGPNIPPPKHLAPKREVFEEEQEYDQEGQSEFDENG